MSSQRITNQLPIAFLAVWAASSAPVLAATFTVPLFPTIATAPAGNYLSTAFDFGTAFSQVESLTLEFALPGGYEGHAITTGNSSYFRSLSFILHDATVPITNAWSIDSEDGITRSVFHVPVTGSVSVDFSGFSYSFGGISVEPSWPEFILQGQGRLAFIDVFESSFHPLPTGITVSSTTSWQPPAGIAGATLTIVGVPVPEPSSVLIPAISSAFCIMCLTRRRQRSASRVSATSGLTRRWSPQ